MRKLIGIPPSPISDRHTPCKTDRQVPLMDSDRQAPLLICTYNWEVICLYLQWGWENLEAHIADRYRAADEAITAAGLIGIPLDNA